MPKEEVDTHPSMSRSPTDSHVHDPGEITEWKLQMPRAQHENQHQADEKNSTLCSLCLFFWEIIKQAFFFGTEFGKGGGPEFKEFSPVLSHV